MERINPNSSIRSGYGFEDLHVLKLCTDWLKVPELYKEIRVQYVPDSISGSGFSIDDVVVSQPDGSFLFYQLKHVQNVSTDIWDFNKLIEKGLNKWINSIDNINKADIAGTGYLITNAAPSEDINNCLKNEEVSLEKIKKLYPIFFKQLLSTHTHGVIEKFFLQFKFEFNAQDKYQLDKVLRETLYYELKVTKAGVDNLLLEIGKQGSEKYPRVFTLNEIRALLSWDNPRPLNQNFDVPADFEFFNIHQHKDIINSLQKTDGGIQVIIGKPGTGKSTYLSKLYSVLNSKLNIFAVRHHYHINPKDNTFRDRLNADRVKEALRAEFKKQKEDVIGELSIQNTEHVPLREFINKISKYYFEKDKTFVLIIDGLDHVLREGKSEKELSEFLHEILYPQPGFWLVLGTQEMAVSSFPNVVHSYCPNEKWIEIKGLNKKGVEKILLNNKSGLELPLHKELLAELTKEVFAKTQGNALHLRYVLNQLKERNESLSVDTLQTILPYKAEIKDYYSDLWRQLPSLSQSFSFAITCLDFKIHEEQLFELASFFSDKPNEITDCFKQIKHLIRIDLHGISVYHNSFMVFMLDQPELQHQKVSLYKQIRNWLKKSDNEELKWSELAKIEYYLGNSKPILALNKNWVIKSFLECRDGEQISKLLEIATEAAYKVKDYEKVISFKLLQVTFNNRDFNLHEAIPKIWTTAYVSIKSTLPKYPQFQKFNHFQLKEILVELYNKGKIRYIPDEAIERFNDLLLDRSNDHDDVARCWIELLAHFDTEGFKRAFNFIIQFREKNNRSASDYFTFYLQQIINNKNDVKINQLLNAKLEKEEKEELTQELLLYELILGSNKWVKKIHGILKDIPTSNLSKLYLFFRQNSCPDDLFLAPAYKFPFKIEFHSGKSDGLTDLYIDNFFNGLFMYLAGDKKTVDNWINQSASGWQILLMKKLLQLGIILTDCYNNKKRFDFKDFFISFDKLPDLDFYEDHDIYELRRSVIPIAVKTVIRVGAIINVYNGFSNTLTVEDIKQLTESSWIYRDDIITILNSKEVSLSDDSYKHFRKYVINELETEIMPFRNRANRYADLAIQARAIGKNKDAAIFLNKAAENIISYGNHKDMLLYHIITSIEYCGLAGSVKVKKYIRQITPYVYNIAELTDGDETSSFIYDLGNLMAKFDKNLLYNFYFQSLNKRDYYLSEQLFADIISCLDFSRPVAFAIGNTAIDQSSNNVLSYLAQQDKWAMKALKSIHAVFGEIDYTKNDNSQNDPIATKPKKQKNNCSSVLPLKLNKHLESIIPDGFYRTKYAQNEYLLEWSKYWLNKKGTSLHNTVTVLQELIEPRFEEASESLLDYIYPYALKTNREFAFQCLIWAHANSSSWSSEWVRNLEYSQLRWNKAINDFPERIDQFFDQSIYNSGRNYHYESGYFMPIPKAVQFFIDAGDLSKSETITEHYIKILPMLFPDVRLNMPDFIEREGEIEELEILLKRFEWLSPLVRERSAWHLGDLLQKDKSGVIHTKFFDWVKKINLESFMCYSLIVILKSLNNPKSYSYKHIQISRLEKLNSLGCRAIDLLLSAIANKLGQDLFISTQFVIAVSYNRHGMSKDKFYKTAGTYIPLVYQDYVERFQKWSKQEIWLIWYSLFKEKCEVLKIVEQKSDKDFGNGKRNYIACRSHIISEILKSTFFNLLDYLFELKIINRDDLFYYNIKNFPVDISIWNVLPSSVPKWWCKFKENEDGNKKDMATVKLDKPIEEIVNIGGNNQLLHMSGSILSSLNHYEDTLQGSIHLLPFGYKVSGNSLPKDKEIYNSLIENAGKWCPEIYDYKNFNFFDNEHAFYNDLKNFSFRIKDLEITFLIGGIMPPAVHIWQYYRLFFHYYLLSPDLQGMLELSTQKNKVEYLSNDKVVCQIHDFAAGVRDNAVFNNDVPHGNYILIEKKYLQNFLSKNNLRLGYVYQIKYKTRDHAFSDEIKEAEFYNSINVSSVII